jgi:preprotein translocase subunit SecA
MMEGRRYSEGLHQALEAKERVTIQNENQTLASITFQNYFRLFPKLAGMTGTAMTEAAEFLDIYGLEVVEMPTNLPCIRIDEHDEVYRTAREKYDSIINLIEECRARHQPVLVGTVSIEKSELLSELLKKRKVPHQVLNARYHEQEAYIIAEAGAPGAVTIATNMAGRGTDIQLGGNLEMRIKRETQAIESEVEKSKLIGAIRADVAAKRAVALEGGGLYVIGTERHESRRIDNQLRGRSGRQGDPGASRFFLSLEDDLMRIFGSERMDSMLQRFGLREGEAIVHPWVNKALEKAQQKVEARNFEARKNVLKFDNVMNDQRKVIYEQRRDLMRATDVSGTVVEMRHETIERMVEQHIPANSYAEQWNTKGLHEEVLRIFAMDQPVADWAKEEGIAEEEIRERLIAAADKHMAEKEERATSQVQRFAEKSILLQLLDREWKDHLLALDHLRHGIGLRAYGQRDPLNEYKREAFEMFEGMLSRLREQITIVLAHIEARLGPAPEQAAPPPPAPRRREFRPNPALEMAVAENGAAPAMPNGDWSKTPRNAPCPCGSGRKFKYCHGKV